MLVGVGTSGLNAQAIWREALAIDSNSWRGPANPATAFHTILDGLLDKGEADPTLLDRLSNTPLADLGSYPRRSEVWSHIARVSRRNLLAATASGWLRSAYSTEVPFVPEDTLQSAILENDEFDPTLDELMPDRIGAVVGIVSVLDGYDERRFLRLIDDMTLHTSSLTRADAEAIGRLILEREWENAAADIVGRYKIGRRDLRPTLSTCRRMIGFWDRYTLDLEAVPKSEKWQFLESLATELYPGGPDDQGLWERAGGKDADLPSKSDGRTRWGKAMRDMRNGRGPAPSALLADMKEDFPNNEQIGRLVKDPAFLGDVRVARKVKKRRRTTGKKHD